MLFHTGDLGSRLDTLDDIETEKSCPYPQNCFIALKFISLVQLMLVHGMRTAVCQCLQVSDRDHEGSEVKWVMAGYCEHCDTTLEELYTERTGPQTHSDRVYSDSCSH